MIKGSIVALITPFNEDGSENFDKLGELIEWHIANKTDAILVLGTTGESSTTLHEEDEALVKFTVKKVDKRVPVIAGGGSNCTQTSKEKCKRFQDAGVDGLLLISPYYNKTNDEGMYHHFADVADTLKVPAILYNVPSRTGCNISVRVVERLSHHENIVGIKEASGNLAYTMEIARLINDNFAMYSGNDNMIIPLMALGASGVISVFANMMPRETHDMVMDYLNGDTEKALDAQLKYLALINALFIEVNPIPIKEAMNLMGMNVGGYRQPLYPMGEENKNKLKHEMERLGIL